MATRLKLLAGAALVGLVLWAIQAGLSILSHPWSPWVSGLATVAGVIGLTWLISRPLARRATVEAELCRANRAWRTISQCNRALIRAGDEAELLHEICRIIVEEGDYQLAWVGYADADAGRTVRPVAQMGYEEGYLESVQISWDDTERGRGPTGTTIRRGEPVVVRNVLTDPRFAPWRAEANRRGYASVIGLPLADDGRSFGALTIYAREPDAFDDDEVELLTHLADDLAYGLLTLRVQAEHGRAERALRESEARNRALLEAIPDMMMQLDRAGRCLDFKAARDFASWGEAAEFLDKDIAAVLPAAVVEPLLARVGTVLDSGKTQVFEFQHRFNHARHSYEARLVPGREETVLAIIRDISERKAREAVIEEERARIARDLHDGLAQSLYFLGLKLDYLRKKVTADPEGVTNELCALKKTAQANIQEVRRTIFSLRPVELDKLGFGPAIRKYTQEFGEQTGLTVKMKIEGDETGLTSRLEPVFFRLVQEGLNNVAKHAQATQVWIELVIRSEQAGCLTIQDDGIGFDPQTVPAGTGRKMGLAQMRERVTMLGGAFQVESVPMTGTTLKAEIAL